MLPEVPVFPAAPELPEIPAILPVSYIINRVMPPEADSELRAHIINGDMGIAIINEAREERFKAAEVVRQAAIVAHQTNIL